MYTILSWLVVCRTTWCLMKSESIERRIPTHVLFVQLFRWPCICEGRHYLIFCFVSWSEELYWHVCSFGTNCLWMNIYKFLIKDANWHAPPIDEYLQNFQLINERFLNKIFEINQKQNTLFSRHPLRLEFTFAIQNMLLSVEWIIAGLKIAWLFSLFSFQSLFYMDTRIW